MTESKLELWGASFEGCNIGSSTGALVATLIGKVPKTPRPGGEGVNLFYADFGRTWASHIFGCSYVFFGMLPISYPPTDDIFMYTPISG